MAETSESDLPERNSTKIMHGVFKHQILLPSGDDPDAEFGDESAEKLKKKKIKSKESQWAKKNKADPNAPPMTRIPLPEMSDSWKADRQQALLEISRRIRLGPEKLPSICFYTFMNAQDSVCSCEISEDSSIMCAGMSNSDIQLWSIDGQMIKPMKKTTDLDQLDREADDVFELMMDDQNAQSRLIFSGHNGPVYSTSLSLDKKLLLSCSADSTVRLWSLQTWSNLVVYRLCDLPFWDVKFCPFSYYFITGSADKCASLWTLDRQQPIRIFAGHSSDINCVNFHPNVNYVASGSDDKTVRIWDVLNGECARLFSDHTAPIQCVQFSSDGRLLATGASDGRVLLYDIGQGRLLADLSPSDTPNQDWPVYTLAFSQENSILAVGGADNRVTVTYLSSLQGETGLNESSSSKLASMPKVQSNEYYTKSTPVLNLHFTRRNLLLAVGSYNQ